MERFGASGRGSQAAAYGVPHDDAIWPSMRISSAVAASSLGSGRAAVLAMTTQLAGSTHSHWPWMPTAAMLPRPSPTSYQQER